MLLRLLALMVFAGAPAWADTPQVPKLDPPALPALVGEEGAARALPSAQVICIDRGRRRCWSGERTNDCTGDGGEVFAEVPLQGGDPGGRLRACWDTLR